MYIPDPYFSPIRCHCGGSRHIHAAGGGASPGGRGWASPVPMVPSSGPEGPTRPPSIVSFPPTRARVRPPGIASLHHGYCMRSMAVRHCRQCSLQCRFFSRDVVVPPQGSSASLSLHVQLLNTTTLRCQQDHCSSDMPWARSAVLPT